MSDTAPIEHPTRLTVGDFTASDDPLRLFAQWLDEATQSEPADANAMALATVDQTGLPNVRMVLLKGFDERGLVFYTNMDSQKGQELARNPKAALLFHWKSRARQIRLRGPVEVVSDAEADAYFASRPRLSRLSAWASPQSAPIADRRALEQRLEDADRRHPGERVPRPPNWGGYRVVPSLFEFWQGRESRLHDRIAYLRSGKRWRIVRLAP